MNGQAQRKDAASRTAIVALSDLDGDGQSWDALMARALTTHPHYSRHVLGAHRAAGLAASDLAVVTVGSGSRIDAMMPFRLGRDICGLGGLVARPFLSPFITQTSPLVADGPDLAGTLDLLVAGLGAASGGRPWRWPLLPTETQLGAGLTAAMLRAGWTVGTSYSFERPMVDRRASHADFLVDHPHRSRIKDLRRRARRLARRGALSFGVAHEGSALSDAVTAFLVLEQAGWKGKAGTALACRPQHAAFARALFADGGGPVGVRADSLFLDGRPLSISLALVVGRTACLLKTTYDEAERTNAPGLVLEAEIIREMHETGFADRLDSATSPISALDNLFPERERIGEIIAIPKGGNGLLSLDRRIGLVRIEHETKARIKRMLGRR